MAGYATAPTNRPIFKVAGIVPAASAEPFVGRLLVELVLSYGSIGVADE